jgi:hypothetical protein
MFKLCKYCKTEKLKESFSPHPHTKDKLSNKCKECVNAYNKLRHSLRTRKDLDQLNLKRRQNRNTWATDRKKHFKRKYGITVEQYNQMLLTQNNTCKICKNICKSGKNLAVDHCHATGKVRGLLCATCNVNLGRIEAYLRDPVPWDNYLMDSVHYINVRTDPGTQLEHRLIAEGCKQIFIEQFPTIGEVAFK